jgi:cell division protease FtsH
MRALVDEAFGRASAALGARRALLEDGAEKLLAQETLTEAELLPLAESARRLAAPD